MKIRNIILQSMSALVISSSLCASPVEQSPIEVQKSKFLKEMIRLIDRGPGGKIGVKTAQAVNMHMKCFVQAFKQYYDEYRACFPQGNPEVDQHLSATLDMHMRDKLLKIMHLNKALIKQLAQKEKGFIKNKMMSVGCATIGVGCSLLALSGVLERVEISSRNVLLFGLFGGAAVISAQGVQRFNALENEIKVHTHLIKLYKLAVDNLNQAHAYAFPGEQKLSDRIEASFGWVE